MAPLTEVEALEECGPRGDRYTDAGNRKSVDYQRTLIQIQNIQAFALASGLPLAPHESRQVPDNLASLHRGRPLT